MSEPLLHVDGLATELATEHGPVRLLERVSFSLEAQKTLGLVGESGCGKSLTALSILQLLPPAARIAAGSIRLGGQELIGANAAQMRAVRGARMAAIFQEPAAALDPVFPVGAQIAEVIRAHTGLTGKEAFARAIESLRQVGIAAPEERAGAFPHQLSGGMLQRVMIAMAISCGPDLLIADEPTTALDATVQAQIIELLQKLRAERRMALLLISHDLALVAQLADEIAVMYTGQIVERAPTPELFRAPKHPYTQGLLRSIPAGLRRPTRLPTLPGAVPAPSEWPAGCRFRNRCPRATDACTRAPALSSEPHAVACHHPLSGAEEKAGASA